MTNKNLDVALNINKILIRKLENILQFLNGALYFHKEYLMNNQYIKF